MSLFHDECIGSSAFWQTVLLKILSLRILIFVFSLQFNHLWWWRWRKYNDWGRLGLTSRWRLIYYFKRCLVELTPADKKKIPNCLAMQTNARSKNSQSSDAKFSSFEYAADWYVLYRCNDFALVHARVDKQVLKIIKPSCSMAGNIIVVHHYVIFYSLVRLIN